MSTISAPLQPNDRGAEVANLHAELTLLLEQRTIDMDDETGCCPASRTSRGSRSTATRRRRPSSASKGSTASNPTGAWTSVPPVR